MAETPKKRSPSYPAIDLEEALRRTRQLWEKQHDYLTPLSAVFSIWGYESNAGNANLVVAALRKFGLVDYEGSGTARKVKVTPLAIQILDHPLAPKRVEAKKEAALLPSIHAELWAQYGAKVPTDDHLRWELEQERGFSRTGAAEFIREYRRTIAYAGLTEGDTVAPQTLEPPTPEDEHDEDDHQERTPPKPPLRRERPAGVVTYSVPLKPGSDIVVEFPYAPTDDDWDFFVGMLNAVRSRLVAKPDRTGESVSSEED